MLLNWQPSSVGTAFLPTVYIGKWRANDEAVYPRICSIRAQNTIDKPTRLTEFTVGLADYT